MGRHKEIAGAFICFALVCVPIAPLEAERISTAVRLRELNNELLRIHANIRQAAPAEASYLRARASGVLEARAAVLKALIEENSRQAMSLAFSPDLLAELAETFPDSASQLESRGIWQGRIEHWIVDNAETRPRSVYRLRTKQHTLDVYFTDAAPADIKSGDVIWMAGVLAGDAVLAADAGIQSPAEAAVSCGATGIQNTAVLLVTFPGLDLPSNITHQSVYDMFFSPAGPSLAGYWREASYGQMSAAGDVFGPYTLDSAYNDCTRMDLLRDAAITAAGNAGVNFQTVNRIFIVTPDMCGWTGLAMNSCAVLNSPSGPFTAAAAFLNGRWQRSQSEGAQNAAHEGGHTLGLAHAQTRDFGTEALGPLNAPGTLTEYGDRFSVMATSNFGHYAAPHKAEILKWLPSATNYQVVESSGTWTLQPFEINTTALQALKVRRGAGNNAWLWIEYRQPIGGYDSTLWSQPFSGALIHYADASTGFQTQLLDFIPETDSWYDPALPAPQTWVDPYTNLSITVQSATPSGLTVNISYGTMPCTHANPSVSMSPANPSVSPGSSVNYTVSVVNNDAAGCAAGTFNLSSTQPSGWSGALSAGSLILNPGQAGSVTLTETIPSGTAPGTYAINASAASGTLAGSAGANCTVVAAPSLSVSLSVPGAAYKARQSVSMTAVVTNGGNPLAGAAVRFTMTKAGGAQATKTATTDSTGRAVWSYKIGPKDPKGTYSGAAQADYGSATATSNAVTFTVQ